MSPIRIASLCVGLLAAASAIGCEPNDQFSPPTTPQNTMVPHQDAPTAAAPDATGATGDAMYASDEVAIGAESDGYDDDDPAALTDFHTALDPNGVWADDGTYGRVWVPSPTIVGSDFHPYVTAGHWTYDDDWVWVSDYEWGWAPFHYGRWVWIDHRGWSWIPGRAYRGAWVAWGVDDGYAYIGWAPMPPAFVWFGGFAVAFPVYVAPRWVYCSRGEVFSPAVRTRIVAGAAVAPVAARVRPYVPATPGVAGPPPQKMGFQSAEIPRAVGAASVARAQQFARPSTAEPLGARAPTRISPLSPAGQTPGGGAISSARHGVAAGLPIAESTARRAPTAAIPGPPRAPATTTPGAGRYPTIGGAHAAPYTGGRSVAPIAPTPMVRGGGGRSPTFHGGSGGHHR